MTHVFTLMLFIGGTLIEPPMYFHKIETCLYYAERAVTRYGTMETQKHFGLAYCVPTVIDPDKTTVY